LSNAQWDEVRKSEDLPEGARKRIDFEIGLYRVGIGEGAASNPQETKANLERALKATSSLRASLQDLNASAYAELVDGKWQNDERLRELAAAVSELETRLSTARDEIQSLPTRDRRNLDRLVAGLDAVLLEYTGRGMSRSNKTGKDSRPFVAEVIRIADPKIGPGSVDEATKAAISGRRAAW
jgi:hypothetical protein